MKMGRQKGWRHPRRDETTYLNKSNSSTDEANRGVYDELVCRREPMNLFRRSIEQFVFVGGNVTSGRVINHMFHHEIF